MIKKILGLNLVLVTLHMQFTVANAQDKQKMVTLNRSVIITIKRATRLAFKPKLANLDMIV